MRPKRDRICPRVDKTPKAQFIQDKRRNGRLIVFQRRDKGATLKSKKGGGRENRLQMIAFANKGLHLLLVTKSRLKELFKWYKSSIPTATFDAFSHGEVLVRVTLVKNSVQYLFP